MPESRPLETSKPPASPSGSDDRVADPARLAALEALALLDTPPEEGFDDIVHLVAQACDAPVALVSLVDRDRQWFKARVGFPDCETDLNRSVCKFALGADDILTVPDLAADPRTCDNPLVTGEPYIRFYAGAPLRTAEGTALGSLCVIDHLPRPDGLTEGQADALRRFARQVMRQVEMRQAVRLRDDLLTERGLLERQRAVLGTTQAGIARAGGRQDAVLEAVLAGAMEAVPAADGAVLGLVDGDALEYHAVRGSLKPHRGLRVPFEGSASGRCYRAASPVLVTDARTDDGVDGGLIEAPDLGSAVHVPVIRGERVLGVLTLQSRRADAFTERDLTLLQLFAGTATAGLTQVSEAAAQAAVRAGEARYQAVFESITDYAIVVMDLDGHVTDWNAGAERILGWTAEEVRGRPADVFFTPEDRVAGIADQEMHGALTEGRGADERWHLRKGGERFFALGEMVVLRDEAGTATGFVKVLRDRTGQRLAEERLRQSDERLQMALTASGDVGLWDWMVDTDLLHGDAHFARLYGLDVERTAAGVTMEQYQAFVVPEDIPPLRAAIRETFERGADFLIDYRLAIPGRPLSWVECKGRLIHDEAGKPVRFSGTAVDVSARKAADAEAKKLAAIVAQSSDFIGIADADWRIEWINEAGLSMVGFPGTSAEGVDRASFYPPETWNYIEQVVVPALQTDGRWRGELRMRRFDTGAEFPVLYDLIAIRDAGGRVIGYATVTRDITEQKRAEEHQELLNHELSHRMKNLLAMVQAIATSTLRGATDVEAAREVLSSRLVALGKAHDVLLGGAVERAPLGAVVRQGVGVQESAGERVVYEGPDVEIGGRAALSLALTLHELTTNAIKYGALSVPEGRVAVTAAVLDAPEGPGLRIAWTERGGPPVRPPMKKGFGSRLIERGLTAQVGGRIALDYPPEGVTCVVEAPLAGFQAVH
ncbi:PAS domain S-box protein [Methylorubrum podarium]|uniref:Blue-light-activated histidine kinase n=1 Tax=Methylorubrum podarium TaxID=200476 RepID=A0ABV1QK16_9HYPH